MPAPIIPLNSHDTPIRGIMVILIWGKRGTEKFSKFPKIT